MDCVICPYNADHKVHGAALRMHLMTCQSKSVREKPSDQQPSKQKAKWTALSLKKEEEEKERRLEREGQGFDPLDPDGLLQCPYDSSHQIRACRFPYHLVKCRKNHMELANKLVTCPFNARHILSRGELSFHISSCDDRRCIEPDIGDERVMYQIDPSPGVYSAPPCEEDWDKELQGGKAAYLWGTPSNPGPCTGSLMDPNNSLGFNLRAPKSVPYVLPWKMNTKA